MNLVELNQLLDRIYAEIHRIESGSPWRLILALYDLANEVEADIVREESANAEDLYWESVETRMLRG